LPVCTIKIKKEYRALLLSEPRKPDGQLLLCGREALNYRG